MLIRKRYSQQRPMVQYLIEKSPKEGLVNKILVVSPESESPVPILDLGCHLYSVVFYLNREKWKTMHLFTTMRKISVHILIFVKDRTNSPILGEQVHTLLPLILHYRHLFSNYRRICAYFKTLSLIIYQLLPRINLWLIIHIYI